MEVKNIETELKNAPIDKGASIKIAKLTGDDALSIFAAEVAPHSRLNPHYHTSGIETYQVYRGTGLMRIGRPDGETAVWTDELHVKTGDCFSIPEGSVHQIVNESDAPLMVIFSCPAAHLGNDRFFVKD
ncbi:MAG: hypothetical protein A2Y33_01290 [Spirochaetes bacterium GWF1_51_8]|nr:MAG: hypothetical protein A2Y33_01290 [Spirochaetes bacterium GWF1_51_8]